MFLSLIEWSYHPLWEHKQITTNHRLLLKNSKRNGQVLANKLLWKLHENDENEDNPKSTLT